MNDDREVHCYALLAQHLTGQEVKAAAKAAWAAQKEADEGCLLLGRTLLEARVLTPEDAWLVARTAAENSRPRTAKAVIALLLPAQARRAADALDNPARYLSTKSAQHGSTHGAHRVDNANDGNGELDLIALIRLAQSDAEAAAAQLQGPWSRRLPLTLSATAWAHVAKAAAMKQQPVALDDARKAWQQWEAAGKPAAGPGWSDELLAWQVRAALRQADADKASWRWALKAIDAMSAAEQSDATWAYWRARAIAALAPPGAEGDAQRAAARRALESISSPFSFYGKLALEDLGGRIALPPQPVPPSPAERQAARSHPGLLRGLHLIGIGLRGEGVREWNYSLRGMAERELLAAAQMACEREVWDRCIGTSERTRTEIDIAQRFPTPFRDQVEAKARQVGLDPAVLYGLMRQESRFIADARSGVGANGLMQIMPATAKWTAKQIGMPYEPGMIADRDTNLLLGASYLKRVMDDFGGSLAMAAAAYNAGPGRPRRWREGGAVLEPAAWAECIPFNETRDYVKKVLSNSVDYAAVLGTPPGSALTTLKARLGPAIGPQTGLREAGAAAPDRDKDTP
jgi:soluble lytic murein transglycosylase